MTLQTATPDNKVSIAPTLRTLKVGQTAYFPHIQYDGIVQGIQRLQRKYKADGLKFSHSSTGTSVEVTRKA